MPISPGSTTPPPPPYETLQNEYEQQNSETTTTTTSMPKFFLVPNLRLGPYPTTVICPSCHHNQTTRIEHRTSSRTHYFAFLLGITLGLCFIPYFMNSCKNANHLCSNCGAYLGTFMN